MRKNSDMLKCTRRCPVKWQAFAKDPGNSSAPTKDPAVRGRKQLSVGSFQYLAFNFVVCLFVRK